MEPDRTKVVSNNSGHLPNVFHFQGSSKSQNIPIWDNLASSEDKLELPMDISIVTFATGKIKERDSPLIRQLKKSEIVYSNPAAAFDYAQYGGWSNVLKPKLALESLKNIKTKYVLVADSADVVIQTFDNIIENFKTYQKPVLFGATKNRHPNQTVDIVSDRDLRGDYCYLNAGTCFGETLKVTEFYQAAAELEDIDNPEGSEQLLVRMVFNDNQEWVDFDWQRKVFQTFSKTTLEIIAPYTFRAY